jgi:hypothetical protein
MVILKRCMPIFSSILARAGKCFFVRTRTCPGFAGRIVIKAMTFVLVHHTRRCSTRHYFTEYTILHGSQSQHRYWITSSVSRECNLVGQFPSEIARAWPACVGFQRVWSIGPSRCGSGFRHIQPELEWGVRRYHSCLSRLLKCVGCSVGCYCASGSSAGSIAQFLLDSDIIRWDRCRSRGCRGCWCRGCLVVSRRGSKQTAALWSSPAVLTH